MLYTTGYKPLLDIKIKKMKLINIVKQNSKFFEENNEENPLLSEDND